MRVNSPPTQFCVGEITACQSWRGSAMRLDDRLRNYAQAVINERKIALIAF
jgi:hypothetical protein